MRKGERGGGASPSVDGATVLPTERTEEDEEEAPASLRFAVTSGMAAAFLKRDLIASAWMDAIQRFAMILGMGALMCEDFWGLGPNRIGMVRLLNSDTVCVGWRRRSGSVAAWAGGSGWSASSTSLSGTGAVGRVAGRSRGGAASSSAAVGYWVYPDGSAEDVTPAKQSCNQFCSARGEVLWRFSWGFGGFEVVLACSRRGDLAGSRRNARVVHEYDAYCGYLFSWVPQVLCEPSYVLGACPGTCALPLRSVLSDLDTLTPVFELYIQLRERGQWDNDFFPTEPVTCEAHPYSLQVKARRTFLYRLPVQSCIAAVLGRRLQQCSFFSSYTSGDLRWLIGEIGAVEEMSLRSWAQNTNLFTVCEHDSQGRHVLNATVLHATFLWPSLSSRHLHARRVSHFGRHANVSHGKAMLNHVAIRFEVVLACSHCGDLAGSGRNARCDAYRGYLFSWVPQVLCEPGCVFGACPSTCAVPLRSVSSDLDTLTLVFEMCVRLRERRQWDNDLELRPGSLEVLGMGLWQCGPQKPFSFNFMASSGVSGSVGGYRTEFLSAEERFTSVKTKLCGNKAVDIADLEKYGMHCIVAAMDWMKWTEIATFSELRVLYAEDAPSSLNSLTLKLEVQ
ncbi:hypothetical protein Taro_029911 [Colocasia esculenta]|uniref:Uncharacterized protein n=1 Tax=Colocasia esculenta TaxID=4460 RepID=A0A843VWB0_COLES|nr:hypothetical protein [Colocasia esculenta]